METNAITEKKLENIELQLQNIKLMMLELIQNQEPKKIIQLKGVLKGAEISDEDIVESKNSLFKIGA